MREAPDAGAVGGLWIVRASSRAEVEGLLQSDPFWIRGLRIVWRSIVGTGLLMNR
ncbi:hypothetical protein KAF44_16670 [Cupriavidus necator]|nr:hypothetical protein KAF44_16670 [Cupriavidus necator]